jgi:hypothetical protein
MTDESLELLTGALRLLAADEAEGSRGDVPLVAAALHGAPDDLVAELTAAGQGGRDGWTAWRALLEQVEARDEALGLLLLDLVTAFGQVPT